MDRASIFIILRFRADSRYHEKGTMQLHVLEIGPLAVASSCAGNIFHFQRFRADERL